jgi:hypothetical protein
MTRRRHGWAHASATAASSGGGALRGMSICCAALSLLVVSVAGAQSRTPSPPAPAAAGRPLVIFLPGREQGDRASTDVQGEYYVAFTSGLARLRAQTGLSDLDVPDGDRRMVDYSAIYATGAAPPVCSPRVTAADSAALAGLGKARTHLSSLVGDIASVQKWVASVVPEESADEPAGIGGGSGAGAGSHGVGQSVNRQASMSVLLMANSTLQAQLGEATYIAGELDRAAADLRAAGRASLADGVHDESRQLVRLQAVLHTLSQAITSVTSRGAAYDGVQGAPPGAANRLGGGSPDFARDTVQRVAATLADRMTALTGAMRAVDRQSGSLTADVFSSRPADWRDPSDSTAEWITSTGQQLSGGPTVAAGFEADTRNYLGQWPYRCETNRVLLDSLFGANRADRPIVLVSHGLGSLIGYGTIYALDAGVAMDNLRVQSFIALGSPLGGPAVMPTLMGRSGFVPYIYPSRIMNWVIVRAVADPVAFAGADRVFDANYGRPFQVLVTQTLAGNPHDVVGYLDNLDTAREIAAAWCRAFDGNAMANRPAACGRLLQSMGKRM